MKTNAFLGIAVCLALFLLGGFIMTCVVNAQIKMQPYPIGSSAGWSAQAWNQESIPGLPDAPENWVGFVSEAFQYAPDGSFFEVSEEEVAMKFTVTIYAEEQIIDHQIPIDSAVITRIFIDGIKVFETPINSHSIATLFIEEGEHVIDIIVEGGVYWTLIGVGPCWWGTDTRIQFVKAGK